MKSVLPTILFLIISGLHLNAQQQVNFNRQGRITTYPKEIHYHRKVTPVAENIWLVTEHYAAGGLKRTVYTSTYDQAIERNSFRAEGEEISYLPNGHIKSINHFKSGKPHGESIIYSTNGKISERSEYIDGHLVLKTVFFDDSAIADSTNYYYTERGTEEHFISYYENGVMAREEYFVNDDLIAGNYFDTEGTPCEYFPYNEKAEYKGGIDAMHAFIARNLIYPREAIKKKAQGHVYVKFDIDTNGSVVNPVLVRTVDYDLDQAALNIIFRMPNWTPAKRNGLPYKSSMTIPINFNLR